MSWEVSGGGRCCGLALDVKIGRKCELASDNLGRTKFLLSKQSCQIAVKSSRVFYECDIQLGSRCSSKIMNKPKETMWQSMRHPPLQLKLIGTWASNMSLLVCLGCQSQHKNLAVIPALGLVTKGGHAVYWIYCIVQMIVGALSFCSVSVVFFCLLCHFCHFTAHLTSECGKKFFDFDWFLIFFQLNVMALDGIVLFLWLICDHFHIFHFEFITVSILV